MLTTPAELCKLSLKAAGILGVGQTALAEDFSDAFDLLNAMLAQWQRQRCLVYHLIDVSKASTGAQSYVVGPGGDFDIPRAERLEAGFFRQLVNSQPNQVDFPLEILESREDYNQIRLKQLNSTLPRWVWFDSGWPYGTVYPWPVPMAGLGELHLAFKQAIGSFMSYTQDINLPPEYREALWSNLTVRLGAIYPGAAISDDTRRIAQSSLAVIRGANTQIPRMRMPKYLYGRSRYDAWSDTHY